jgi:hypothetical protein
VQACYWRQLLSSSKAALQQQQQSDEAAPAAAAAALAQGYDSVRCDVSEHLQEELLAALEQACC